jgi:hypothetical protein
MGTGTSLLVPGISLGFSFPFYGTTCTSVTVSMDGYIYFNNDPSLIIAALDDISLTTTSYGTVGYRTSSVSSEMQSLSQVIRTAFSTDSVFNFTATHAFAASYSQIQNAFDIQIVILTDGYFSFFMVSFFLLTGSTMSRYGYYSNGYYSPVSIPIPSSTIETNCGLPGQFIYLTNGNSKFLSRNSNI